MSRMTTMKRCIDFAAINRAALAALPALLRRWMPDGKAVGRRLTQQTPAGDQPTGANALLNNYQSSDGPRP